MSLLTTDSSKLQPCKKYLHSAFTRSRYFHSTSRAFTGEQHYTRYHVTYSSTFVHTSTVLYTTQLVRTYIQLLQRDSTRKHVHTTVSHRHIAPNCTLHPSKWQTLPLVATTWRRQTAPQTRTRTRTIFRDFQSSLSLASPDTSTTTLIPANANRSAHRCTHCV